MYGSTGANASVGACRSPARDGSPDDEQLDIQKALQIVKDHYGKRNAAFSLLKSDDLGLTLKIGVVKVPHRAR